MLPDRKTAIALVNEGLKKNPGAWGRHSECAAHCALCIASACGDLDPEKAYVLGLLHDIGRTFGVRHLGHVSDGYTYMKHLGYDEAARICLTHSFITGSLDEYIGKFDVAEDELQMIREHLYGTEFDDYDRLIQICDAMAGADGVMDIRERMEDVRARYGSYPGKKWDATIALMHYFEKKTGGDLYEICDMKNYHTEIFR